MIGSSRCRSRASLTVASVKFSSACFTKLFVVVQTFSMYCRAKPFHGWLYSRKTSPTRRGVGRPGSYRAQLSTCDYCLGGSLLHGHGSFSTTRALLPRLLLGFGELSFYLPYVRSSTLPPSFGFLPRILFHGSQSWLTDVGRETGPQRTCARSHLWWQRHRAIESHR